MLGVMYIPPDNLPELKEIEMVHQSLGDWLKSLRKSNYDLAQRGIADDLKVTKQHISNLEQGKSVPSFAFLMKLYDYLLPGNENSRELAIALLLWMDATIRKERLGQKREDQLLKLVAGALRHQTDRAGSHPMRVLNRWLISRPPFFP